MHFPRKYEAGKSKTETLRDENVFLELKVRTESFYLFQIYKLFTVMYQTCVVTKYSVYIIVSDRLLFITVFDDLDLYFKLKHHYPSLGTSAYFPRGTSAHRHHHCKCCIMIIIMKLYSNMCACVYVCAYVRIYVRMCGRVCVRMCGAHVRTHVRTKVRACEGACMCVRLHVRALVGARVGAFGCGHAYLRARV